MRIVFMGTPAFAAISLQKILEKNFNVVAVYTQQPKPMGRGYEVTKSATHILAEQNTIPVFTPTTLRTSEAQDELRALSPDICVVAAYGFILPQAILDIPLMGCVNIHASLLPRWRGAAPIQHAILKGDHETGITLMNMDVGMDTGDILYKRSTPITSSNTSQLLFAQLADLGAEMIVDYLQAPTSYLPTPQPTDGVTMAPKIDKSMAHLDWTKTASELERQLRAFTPWPGVTTQYKDTLLKVGGLKVIATSHAQQPGTILNDQLHVACGGGSVLAVISLRRPGGKMLETQEFLKGLKLPAGDSLTKQPNNNKTISLTRSK